MPWVSLYANACLNAVQPVTFFIVSETCPSFLNPWSRLRLWCWASPRPFLIRVYVVQAIPSNGPRIRLSVIFLEELLLRAGHTAWCYSAEETSHSAIRFVDSFVLASPGTWRCPVHCHVQFLWVGNRLFALSRHGYLFHNAQTVLTETRRCAGKAECVVLRHCRRW
jgi:hypothetical protein